LRLSLADCSGARRVDERRAISGILHVLKAGGRRCDRPGEYGPMLTPGNVAAATAAPMVLKKAGRMRRRVAEKSLPRTRSRGYGVGSPRANLRQGGTVPVIPRAAAAKRPFPTTRRAIANATSSRTPSADFRRTATRHDKLAVNFLSAVALATAAAFWT